MYMQVYSSVCIAVCTCEYYVQERALARVCVCVGVYVRVSVYVCMCAKRPTCICMSVGR